MVSLIGLVVVARVPRGFLRWKAATPGKLALGMRVRLRETPGQMSWGTILKRWGGQFGTPLATVPVLGSIAGLYPLLDGLWPLWDSKKQALHDKIAATNVVPPQRGERRNRSAATVASEHLRQERLRAFVLRVGQHHARGRPPRRSRRRP